MLSSTPSPIRLYDLGFQGSSGHLAKRIQKQLSLLPITDLKALHNSFVPKESHASTGSKGIKNMFDTLPTDLIIFIFMYLGSGMFNGPHVVCKMFQQVSLNPLAWRSIAPDGGYEKFWPQQVLSMLEQTRRPGFQPLDRMSLNQLSKLHPNLKPHLSQRDSFKITLTKHSKIENGMLIDVIVNGQKTFHPSEWDNVIAKDFLEVIPYFDDDDNEQKDENTLMSNQISRIQLADKVSMRIIMVPEQKTKIYPILSHIHDINVMISDENSWGLFDQHLVFPVCENLVVNRTPYCEEPTNVSTIVLIEMYITYNNRKNIHICRMMCFVGKRQFPALKSLRLCNINTNKFNIEESSRLELLALYGCSGTASFGPNVSEITIFKKGDSNNETQPSEPLRGTFTNLQSLFGSYVQICGFLQLYHIQRCDMRIEISDPIFQVSQFHLHQWACANSLRDVSIMVNAPQTRITWVEPNGEEKKKTDLHLVQHQSFAPLLLNILSERCNNLKFVEILSNPPVLKQGCALHKPMIYLQRLKLKGLRLRDIDWKRRSFLFPALSRFRFE